jgi:succinate-semialdehyde dehydrogenase/glutarate-semialdehyde dehydrogenase
MRAQAPHLAHLITPEMGKLMPESLSEVELSASILDYYAFHAEKFLGPVDVPETEGSVILTQPVGVLLAIEPWNFPYYQLARVAGPQLVAGNVVMVKHARNVPQCALAFARILSEAGLQRVFIRIYFVVLIRLGF